MFEEAIAFEPLEVQLRRRAVGPPSGKSPAGERSVMRLRRSSLGESHQPNLIRRGARNGFIIGLVLAAVVLTGYLIPRLSGPLDPGTGMGAAWLAALFCFPFGQFYVFAIAKIFDPVYYDGNPDINVAMIVVALLLNWLTLGALVGLMRHEARDAKRPAA